MLLFPPRSWQSWVCKETRKRHSSFNIHTLKKTMLKRSFSKFHRGNRQRNYSTLQAENYFCCLQTTSLMFLRCIIEQASSHFSSSKSAPCSLCWSSYEPSAPTHSAEVWEVRSLAAYLCISSLLSDPGMVKLSSWPWQRRITCPPTR